MLEESVEIQNQLIYNDKNHKENRLREGV